MAYGYFFGRTRTRTAVPQKPKIAVLYGRTVQYDHALSYNANCSARLESSVGYNSIIMLDIS